MLYYDLHFDDSIIIQIDNYRKFLNRNIMVTKSRKETISKFLNALEKLVYLREGNPGVDSSNLSSDVRNLKDLNYKNWFLEKLSEIKDM
jgi:hypothetical protein